MSDIIQIPYCTLLANGLEIKSGTSKEQWEKIGTSLKMIEKSTQFWIRDWIVFGEKNWGEMYDEAERITGLSNGALRNIKYVGDAIPLSCRHDDLSFTHHQEVASLPPTDQARVLKKASEEKLTVRQVRDEVKSIKRNDEKRESVPLPSKKFQIIYADPPWSYDRTEEFFGQDVEKHYPTMSPEELFALDVKNLADKDCVLYLWTTAPKLNIGLKVLEAWGFDYKSCIVWDKVKHNMGFYSSVRHEILLIGGKGQSAPTDKKYANQTDSVYVEERTEHSKKPEYYYEMIEKMHPTKNTRLEMFARASRKGWTKWGNE